MTRSLRSLVFGLGLIAGWFASVSDETARWQGLSLGATAAAQTTGDYRLENVSFSFGPVRYEAKRVEVLGGIIARDALEALLRPSNRPLEPRLSEVGAKQILIPEMVATTKVGDREEVVVYRDLVLKDIVQGRVSEISAASMETKQPKDTFELRYGRTTVREIDLPAIARIYEQKVATDAAPLQRIYGEFLVENITARDQTNRTDMRIERIAGRDFSARPLEDGWNGVMTLLTELSVKDEPSAEDQKKLLPAVADIMGGFDIGLVEATGLSMTAPKPEGSGVAKAKVARIAYTGAAGGRPAEAHIEGLQIEDDDTRIAVATTSVSGFSLAPTLQGLKAMAGKPSEEWDARTFRALLPVIGTFRQAGVEIDVPGTVDSENPKPKPARFQATLKASEFTVDRFVDGIPTNVRLAWQNLATTLPKDSDDDWVRTLRGLGYEAVDTSAALGLAYDGAKNEVTVRELSLGSERMGRVSIDGVLGNVSNEAFLGDGPSATAAWIGAKAKNLTIRIEDAGLFERYLARTGKAEKKSPDALRKSYKEMVQVLVTGLLGSSKDAGALRSAATAFVDKPGTLVITATSKDPNGISMLEFMGLSDPKAILSKLDVTARVQDRP